MNAQSPKKLQLVLAQEEETGRVVVDLDAFLTFNRTMNQRLVELEGKWAHLAAPNASAVRRSGPRRWKSL